MKYVQYPLSDMFLLEKCVPEIFSTTIRSFLNTMEEAFEKLYSPVTM